MNRNIKGQSETIGFIVIILMVMIIGVIFLGIAIKPKGGVIATDSEIANFLITSLEFRTDCAKDYEPNYLYLKEVVSECYSSNTQCLDGRDVCFVLNKTYSEMLTNFRPSGKVLSYYKLGFYYLANLSRPISTGTKFGTEIVWGNSSTCSSKRAARKETSLNPPGGIVEQLEVCLAS